MTIRAKCPGCPAKHDLLDSLNGYRVRCKECQKIFLVRDPRAGSGDDAAGAKASKSALDRLRARAEKEMAASSYEAGPSTAGVVGALIASGVFVAALTIILVAFWTK
jgi:hypothetical protein